MEILIADTDQIDYPRALGHHKIIGEKMVSYEPSTQTITWMSCDKVFDDTNPYNKIVFSLGSFEDGYWEKKSVQFETVKQINPPKATVGCVIAAPIHKENIYRIEFYVYGGGLDNTYGKFFDKAHAEAESITRGKAIVSCRLSDVIKGFFEDDHIKHQSHYNDIDIDQLVSDIFDIKHFALDVLKPPQTAKQVLIGRSFGGKIGFVTALANRQDQFDAFILNVPSLKDIRLRECRLVLDDMSPYSWSPDSENALLMSRNPLLFIHKLQKPILCYFGLMDNRVDFTTALDLWTAANYYGKNHLVTIDLGNTNGHSTETIEQEDFLSTPFYHSYKQAIANYHLSVIEKFFIHPIKEEYPQYLAKFSHLGSLSQDLFPTPPIVRTSMWLVQHHPLLMPDVRLERLRTPYSNTLHHIAYSIWIDERKITEKFIAHAQHIFNRDPADIKRYFAFIKQHGFVSIPHGFTMQQEQDFRAIFCMLYWGTYKRWPPRFVYEPEDLKQHIVHFFKPNAAHDALAHVESAVEVIHMADWFVQHYAGFQFPPELDIITADPEIVRLRSLAIERLIEFEAIKRASIEECAFDVRLEKATS